MFLLGTHRHTHTLRSNIRLFGVPQNRLGGIIGRMANIDKELLKTLFERFKVLEAAGAGKPGHAEHDKRNETLDEMQDAAGLAGRMVMERDILRKAEQLLKG
jgi:hypothetical protein